LINVKFNIGERSSSLAFEIKDGRVVFEDKEVNITAQDVLTSQSNIEALERDRAVEWLKQLLAGGQSMPSKEIMKLAEENGFKKHTLENARKEFGVKCYPDFDEEGNKLWFWKLPTKEGGQSKIPGLAKELEKANAMLKKFKMTNFSSSI
jgi:hypothetical protein